MARRRLQYNVRMTKTQLILNRYKPLAKAGVGGFGTVQVAWDTRIQRKVAIKCIPLSEAELLRAALPGADALDISPDERGENAAIRRTFPLGKICPRKRVLRGSRMLGSPTVPMHRRSRRALPPAKLGPALRDSILRTRRAPIRFLTSFCPVSRAA